MTLAGLGFAMDRVDSMDPNQAAAIDLVEASYNLELVATEWLPSVLRVGESLLDFGLGTKGQPTRHQQRKFSISEADPGETITYGPAGRSNKS